MSWSELGPAQPLLVIYCKIWTFKVFGLLYVYFCELKNDEHIAQLRPWTQQRSAWVSSIAQLRHWPIWAVPEIALFSHGAAGDQTLWLSLQSTNHVEIRKTRHFLDPDNFLTIFLHHFNNFWQLFENFFDLFLLFWLFQLFQLFNFYNFHNFFNFFIFSTFSTL